MNNVLAQYYEFIMFIKENMKFFMHINKHDYMKQARDVTTYKHYKQFQKAPLGISELSNAATGSSDTFLEALVESCFLFWNQLST